MPITDVELSLGSLDQLDNAKVGKLLRAHLRRIAADCYDRMTDDHPRKVAVVFTAVPVLSEDGTCERAKISIACESRVPVYKTRPYEMRITESGFAYNPDSPTHYPQQALPFDQE